MSTKRRNNRAEPRQTLSQKASTPQASTSPGGPRGKPSLPALREALEIEYAIIDLCYHALNNHNWFKDENDVLRDAGRPDFDKALHSKQQAEKRRLDWIANRISTVRKLSDLQRKDRLRTFRFFLDASLESKFSPKHKALIRGIQSLEALSARVANIRATMYSAGVTAAKRWSLGRDVHFLKTQGRAHIGKVVNACWKAANEDGTARELRDLKRSLDEHDHLISACYQEISELHMTIPILSAKREEEKIRLWRTQDTIRKLNMDCDHGMMLWNLYRASAHMS